jgi:nitrous oxide reductase accessory protein NosL
MRRINALFLTLLLAGCATAPRQAPPIPVAPPQPEKQTSLTGLTANELVGHFGTPALQIREGTSLKLQFRGRQCVLDAYLYPQAGNTLRVTHVDTRSSNGADFDQAACIAELENPN